MTFILEALGNISPAHSRLWHSRTEGKQDTIGTLQMIARIIRIYKTGRDSPSNKEMEAERAKFCLFLGQNPVSIILHPILTLRANVLSAWPESHLSTPTLIL
jgi:hypothetical protein